MIVGKKNADTTLAQLYKSNSYQLHRKKALLVLPTLISCIVV